jgi:predicted N-acetyltransferase YhbS
MQRELMTDEVRIDVTPFDASHAAQSVELAARAFTVVAEDARPKDSPAFLAHIHGDANPAGRAWIAVARKAGRAVASVAAVPARFRTRSARTVVGYQIGTFVVDASEQRQGLGSRSLAELTKVLITLPGAFIYAYPNPRSQAPLDRLNYQRVAEIPTRIHLPGWRSLSAKRATKIDDRAGNEWELEILRGSAAEVAVRAIDELENEPPGFVRDRRYFLWRFFGPDSADRYEFAVLRSRSTRRAFVLALARHSFKGQRFTILVDAYPNVFPERHALSIRAAQAAGRRSGAWFVYVNTNAEPTVGAPWSMRLPRARNPRPVQLMIYPVNNAISAEELDASLAMTADWNGF